MHKLTIITRTSARPKQFERLVQTIVKQTYRNMHHLVICDNAQAYEYASEILIRYYHKANIRFSIRHVSTNRVNPGFYNLYLNYAIEQVNDGFILFVDDDDYLVDDTCIERFWNHPKPDFGFYVVQYLRGQRAKPKPTLFPNINYKAGDTSPIVLGKIGGSAVIFRPRHADKAKWDDMPASDYRFIMQLAANNSYTYIEMPIIQSTPTGNLGVPNE